MKNEPASERPVRPATPTLRFTPTAWAKLLCLRDYGQTEVSGFGITASGDLLLVEDIQLVHQTCSWAHVALDDASVADFFDQQVDAGRRPEQFARIWLHTHPGDCPRPSVTDEQTFDRVFGRSDWAVMFILARKGESYARLRFNVGPGADAVISVNIDYTRHFAGSNADAWQQEYLDNVQPQQTLLPSFPTCEPAFASPPDEDTSDDWYDSWSDYTQDDEPARGFVR